MVFSKPEGVGCSVPSAVRALLHARGFTKYHISRWLQSLAGLGYGQYTDMFTCISTYILYKNLIIPCFLVLMYTEATHSAVKKTCSFTIEKRGQPLKIVALILTNHISEFETAMP